MALLTLHHEICRRSMPAHRSLKKFAGRYNFGEGPICIASQADSGV